MAPYDKNPQDFLKQLFNVAIDAVSAEKMLPRYLPSRPKGKTIILAIGKGASSMASTVAKNWPHPYEGLIVTRYGHHDYEDEALKSFEIIEASHPVPDENGVLGSSRALEMVGGLTKDDLVIALISGGGSALLPAPVDGVSLNEKIALTKALLATGATIQEINCVRKHLSKVKGGRLAMAAAPAKIVTLAVSDVVGDDVSLIASGPTVQDSSTLTEARNVIEKYQVSIPRNIAAALANPLNETADISGADYSHNECHIVATPHHALSAAKLYAQTNGYEVIMLGDLIEGEARDIAATHARMIKDSAKKGVPTIVLSGGELTVTLCDNHGDGGPNTEYALALAIELGGHENIWALSCDTDGKDGIGDNAGAIIGPDTLNDARTKGLDPAQYLEKNDSYTFFKAVSGLVITGPTNTNVNDFRIALIK